MQRIALRYFRELQLKHTPRHFPPWKNKGNARVGRAGRWENPIGFFYVAGLHVFDY